MHEVPGCKKLLQNWDSHELLIGYLIIECCQAYCIG